MSSNRIVNNKYIDNNIVSLELSNNLNESNETIKYVINPNTDTGYIIVLILIILLSILIILLIRNRKAKKYIAILLVLLIPITIYALEKIKLEVETYVEIYKLDTFSMNFQCLYDASLEGEVINNARYEKGMTLEDYINSKYFDELKDNVKTYLENILNYDSLDFIYNEIEDCYAETVWPERNSPNYFEEITIAREHDRICGEKYHKTNIARNDLILSMDEGYYTSEYLCDFN